MVFASCCRCSSSPCLLSQPNRVTSVSSLVHSPSALVQEDFSLQFQFSSALYAAELARMSNLLLQMCRSALGFMFHFGWNWVDGVIIWTSAMYFAFLSQSCVREPNVHSVFV